MGKFELFQLILPFVVCLGVYGMTIAARLKKTGWDIKGILMLISFVLPLLGFIITLVVRKIRNKRLKKAEVNENNIPGIPTTGNLFHYRLFIFMKEFTLLMVSFIIAHGLNTLMMFFTIAHITQITHEDLNEQFNLLMNRVNNMDSVSQRIWLDSIKNLP